MLVISFEVLGFVDEDVANATALKDRRSHGSDAVVAPDRHFYAAVRRAAFDALSCPPRAHLEKKTWVPNAVCTFMMSITP